MTSSFPRLIWVLPTLLLSACGGDNSNAAGTGGSSTSETGGTGSGKGAGGNGGVTDDIASSASSGGAQTGGAATTGAGGATSGGTQTGGAATTGAGGATSGGTQTGSAATTGAGGATSGGAETGGAATTGAGGATSGGAETGGAATTGAGGATSGGAETGGAATTGAGGATSGGAETGGTATTGAGGATSGGAETGGAATTGAGGATSGGTQTGGTATTGAGGATSGDGCGTAGTGGASSGTIGTIELYGTFEAMGVIATIPDVADPNGNAAAKLEYRVSGSADYFSGFPLTRVAPTRFVGSLFGLKPGTCYDVRVRYIDPDGAPLDAAWAGATAATRDEITIPAPVRRLNVAPEGSGTDCSAALPCSLSEALSLAQPGDEVLLRAGIYYTGDLSMWGSGTSTAPIVIRGMPSAVLDGSDPSTFTWTSGAGGVFTTTVNQPGPHMVSVDGARLYPYPDLASVTSLSASSTPGFFANGTALTIHLSSDVDPSGTILRISRYNTGLTIYGSFVYVLNLTFQNYGLGENAKALYIRDGSDNLVQGCRFITNDMGIGLKGTTNRNVIEENDISDTISSWTYEDVQTEGNLTEGGLRFYGPVDGRGNIIRRNKFHGMFNGLGICPSTSAAVTNETDFYDNEVYDNGNNGVAIDARCANVRIWNNVIHDILYGIKLAPVLGGPAYCLRNRIYLIGAGHSNAGLTGQSFRFSSGGAQSGWIYLFHNTVDAQRVNNAGFSILNPGTWQGVYARNNVWAGTLSAMENTNPSQPLDLDYDDLWSPGSDYLVHWDGLSNPYLTTLAEMTAATGQESHGISVAPEFAAPNTGDFTPSPSSSLIDHGLYVPGINDGFAGAAPDIGAIESQ